MASKKQQSEPSSGLSIGLWTLGAVTILGGAIWLWSQRSAPQIGADPAVFGAVDALFTAVTAQDQRRLDACEARLREHKDAGRLPERAWQRLDKLIQEALSNRWESAAKGLYDFMQQQRRESPAGALASR